MPSAPARSLVERKVGAGRGGAWRWGAGLSRCWAEGKKEACAGGWLPAAPRGPSTSYSDTGTRNPRCLRKLVPSPLTRCPRLNRGLSGEGEGMAWGAHTRRHTLRSTQSSPDHTHTVLGRMLLPLASVPPRGTSTVHDNSCLFLRPTMCPTM